MKIVLDVNILLSALLFPKSIISDLVNKIAKEYNLILSNTIIDEMKAVVAKKFPSKTEVLGDFFARIAFDYQFIPESYLQNFKAEISDPKDKHVLASAFFTQAEIIITGDNHFFERAYEWIKIMRPYEFLIKY